MYLLTSATGLDRLVPQVRRLVGNRDKLHNWMQEKALDRVLSVSQQNDFFTYMMVRTSVLQSMHTLP